MKFKKQIATPTKRKKLNETLADSMMAEVQKVMDEPHTPTKEKQVCRNMLTKAMLSIPCSKKSMQCKLGMQWKASSSKEGRPQGSYKISDDDLVKALDSQSTDSSMMHLQLQRPIRTLSQSKRLVATEIGMSKSALCRRLRHCKIGYAGAKCQRGKCDACCSWKNYGRKKIVTILAEMWQFIIAVAPDYFQQFDQEVEDEGLNDALLPAPESPEYMQKLLDYLKAGEMREAVRPILEALLLLLVSHESAAIAAIEEVLPDVLNMAWHLALKATIDKLWREAWFLPQPKCCYGLWDHMAHRF